MGCHKTSRSDTSPARLWGVIRPIGVMCHLSDRGVSQFIIKLFPRGYLFGSEHILVTIATVFLAAHPHTYLECVPHLL